MALSEKDLKNVRDNSHAGSLLQEMATELLVCRPVVQTAREFCASDNMVECMKLEGRMRRQVEERDTAMEAFGAKKPIRSE